MCKCAGSELERVGSSMKELHVIRDAGGRGRKGVGGLSSALDGRNKETGLLS